MEIPPATELRERLKTLTKNELAVLAAAVKSLQCFLTLQPDPEEWHLPDALKDYTPRDAAIAYMAEKGYEMEMLYKTDIAGDKEQIGVGIRLFPETERPVKRPRLK